MACGRCALETGLCGWLLMTDGSVGRRRTEGQESLRDLLYFGILEERYAIEGGTFQSRCAGEVGICAQTSSAGVRLIKQLAGWVLALWSHDN